ncbi:hypothetical protein GCM10023346_46730 [Arthrobacter gyeryongensis]|uniref:Uncharacterized protein n=1 Tax=Arthrobacter gyeryongensis TaxID=1650592 RepID=A0ABP9SSW4_9MICC
MTLSLTDWCPSGQQPTVYEMSEPARWDTLLGEYAHDRAADPLRRIFDIARSHGVVCIVKEPRYIDADWRSQLARFYNGAFRRYPSVCHRLHFFTEPVDPSLTNLSQAQKAYRGYTILRPLPVAPVGRTMIAPPPELADAVRCEGDETVDLYGWPLTVRAMPFISQDTQLLRCAHASAWMVLRHATMVHQQPKRLPAEIYDAALGGVVVGRQLPSDGLSSHQLLSALTSLGLSPTSKVLPPTPAAEANAGELRLFAILCRYINSQLPPIVISNSHAWTVVAYDRKPSPGNSAITLWRHDDAAGPYLRVQDPWHEASPAHQPWAAAYLPLLPKAYIDAERAEAVGRTWVSQFRLHSPSYQESTLAETDSRTDFLEQAALRTYLVQSSTFKRELHSRGVPEELAAPLRRAEMSRYLWVIEIVDRKARTEGKPDVLGEILLDATLTQYEPQTDPAAVTAFHLDSVGWISGIDGADHALLSLPNGVRYRTGCPPLASVPAPTM